MFCPRCGQEQTSEHTRFCSRCGFLLDTIAEVLANGGVLPQLLELNERKTLLTRKNGIIFSVFWFILFTIIIPSLGGIMGMNVLPGMSAVIGVFGTIMLIIASLAFLKKTPPLQFTQENFPASQRKNLSGAHSSALPPQQSQPVGNYASPANDWKAPHTGEFAVKPPSVTEETTKLLQKDE